MARTAIVWSDRYLEHDTGAYHPERPARLSAMKEQLDRAGSFKEALVVVPQPADIETVLRVHDADYVERFRQRCENALPYLDTTECPLVPATFDIAMEAAGGMALACDAVMAGQVASAFCPVRPPGHHAEVDRAFGFCYLNNIAIAAEHLRHKHGLRRLAILDFDVHHGNGTQHHFDADPDVLFCSVHQDPRTLFPGTGFDEEVGTGPGVGTTVNCSMAPGSGDDHYRRVFEEQLLPRIAAHRPEFLLISAGFDAHINDPLANVELTTEAFEWMTAQCVRLMRELRQPRIVSVLEGGYDLQALSDCVLAHLQGYALPEGR